jgi:pilus assembly protein CpaD
MKSRFYPIAMPLMLALAACATDYTKSEAPNNLRVDGAQTRISVSFVPGSARLAPGEAARLDQLVATGIIRPADRVTVAFSGTPPLAEQRAADVSRALLTYGIVIDTLQRATVPANQAVVEIGRYTVALPPCPNWSSPPNATYTNAHNSNWGCAAATNLGLMVANPADLVSGRPLAQADGMPAATAVQNYLNGKFKPLPTPTASPFSPIQGGGGAGGGGAGGGDTGGAPGGAPGGGAP